MVQKGEKAPLFESKDQDGNPIKLADFLKKGKKIALYFYPKDDTSGCTAQACNLRDNYQEILQNNIQVIGVSVDDEKSHQKFIRKHNLPFPLVADTDHSVVQAYGVWVEKNMYGRKYMGTARVTFIINEEGIVENVIEKVKTAEHSKQILG
ncbi:MAG: thioredoxin-dependent thiol peroxidase [Raineya sp.]